MIDTPTKMCLPGKIKSITLGHKTPTVEMASRWTRQNGVHRDVELSPRTRDSHIPTADPSWGRRARRARAALHRPPNRRAVVVPRWRSWSPAGVDTFVPRALEYGTDERSQRTAVSRGLAAVVVCGT